MTPRGRRPLRVDDAGDEPLHQHAPVLGRYPALVDELADDVLDAVAGQGCRPDRQQDCLLERVTQ